MNIYATGTSGTIGRHLSKSTVAFSEDLSGNVISLPQGILRNQGIFIHLAGIVGPKAVEMNPSYAFKVNVAAVEKIGKQLLKSNFRKLLFVSTSHVYKRSNVPIDETYETEPQNVYSEQKLQAEAALSDIFSHSPDRLSIVRVFSVLDWDVEPFTLGGGIKKLADPRSSYLLANCDDVRDFLTPKTIASLLESIGKVDELWGVINLCSSKGRSVGEAARLMLQARGIPVPENRLLSGNSTNPYVVGDNSKLGSYLPGADFNWSPHGYV